MRNSVRCRLKWFAASFLVFAVGACGEGSGPTPIDPNSIEGQITSLFPDGPTLRESALARIASVRQSLVQNNTTAARAQANLLVNLTLSSLREGRLVGAKSEATRVAASRLVNDVYQLVSLTPPNIPDGALTDDGAAQVVGPSGGLVVTPSGVAGVQFPPGALPSEVLVTVTRIPAPPVPGTGPLPTQLKQYPPFYEYSTTPAVQFGDSARVGLCQVTNPSNPLYPPEPHDRLRLAHAVAGNQIQILERVNVNDFLVCTNVSPNIETSPRLFGWRGALRAVASGALDLLRPRLLYAAHGGLGGKVKSFSPFAAVDPTGVAAIAINPPTAELDAGRSINLNAVTTDGSGNVVTGRTITWTSSDTTIATVSATGPVASLVGVFGGGAVTITAASEGITAAAVITVVRAPNAPNRAVGSRFPVIAAGENHACGLDAGGKAFCWGANQSGQLGDGTTTARSTPTAVVMPAGVTFTSISTGGQEAFFGGSGLTCALTAGGIAYCWGTTGIEGIGDGTTSPRLVPTQVSMPPGVSFAQVSAGGWHACALSTMGTGYCWGSSGAGGNLGDGTSSPRNVPTPVVMPAGVTFSSISAGYFHTCALSTGGSAYCWGNNARGPIGNGTFASSNVPVSVATPAGVTFTRLATGRHTTCAISSTGTAHCWGWNASSQLGDGTTTARNIPTPVVAPSGVSFSTIAVGSQHGCALATTGVGYCWGDNAGTGEISRGPGALGDGTITNRSIATSVLMPIGVSFKSITVGTSFSCAISTADVRYCWGVNSLGQRGDGTTTP